MSEKKGISRRTFFKAVGAAGASAALMSVPAGTLGVQKVEAAEGKPVQIDHRKYAVDKPTYEVVGELTKCNEMDIVFARNDYLKNFPERAKEYYARNPENEKWDRAIIEETPGLGNVGDPADLWMFRNEFGIVKHLGAEDIVDGKPSPKKVEMSPERAAEKIKGFAHHLGADLVTIGPLNQAWVYSHVGRTFYPDQQWGKPINLPHKYAISLGFKMDVDLIRTGPVVSELVEVGRAYAQAAFVAVQLAAYIRSLGYPARAHHLRNYQVLNVPIAVDSGMGELGRNGFLVTRELGNSLRLSTVTTDLPMALDKPVDIGVQDFCERCKICAEYCPSGAIPEGDKTVTRGVKKWQLDANKCYRYWNETGTDCGQCIAVCPWNKPSTWIHSAAGELAAKTGMAGSILVPMEKVFYGEYEPEQPPAWLEKPDLLYKEVNKKYQNANNK